MSRFSQILSDFQVIVGFVAMCSMCTGVVLIKVIGKRRLYLISLSGVVVTMTALGKYFPIL